MSHIGNKVCLTVSNPQTEYLETYIKEAIHKGIIDIPLQNFSYKPMENVIKYNNNAYHYLHFPNQCCCVHLQYFYQFLLNE